MKQITITLNKILEKNPCTDGWEAILKGRGKAAADDEEFPLSEALQSNSVQDVIWAFRCLPEHDRLWRKFAVWCARQVEHLMTDERSINALEVSWCYSNGEATDEELRTASDAALDAARVASASDASDAAWTTAWVAASDAWAAAARAAWAAAWAAASGATRAASDARAAAWDAQKAKLIQILDAGEWVE